MKKTAEEILREHIPVIEDYIHLQWILDAMETYAAEQNKELKSELATVYKLSEETAKENLRLQKQNEWVSVEDRLPILHQQVVFVLRKGYELPTTAEYYINCKGFWSIVNNVYPNKGVYRSSQLENVTHWQPLPEPPKTITMQNEILNTPENKVLIPVMGIPTDTLIEWGWGKTKTT